MDKPISVGDLVCVVGCCCQQSEKWLGMIFVARPFSSPLVSRSACGKTFTGPFFTDGASECGWAREHLKRIPPADELGLVDIYVEITA